MLQNLGWSDDTIHTIHFMAGMYLAIIPILAFIHLKLAKPTNTKLKGGLYGLAFSFCCLCDHFYIIK